MFMFMCMFFGRCFTNVYNDMEYFAVPMILNIGFVISCNITSSMLCRHFLFADYINNLISFFLKIIRYFLTSSSSSSLQSSLLQRVNFKLHFIACWFTRVRLGPPSIGICCVVTWYVFLFLGFVAFPWFFFYELQNSPAYL
jgi:hypothetical protein